MKTIPAPGYGASEGALDIHGPSSPELAGAPRLRSAVPCNGCTACCRGGELVVLFPEDGDVLTLYDTVKVETEHGTLHLLRHRPNGDCVYLGEHGCTIYAARPLVCRRFDCRKYFLSMPRAERRQMERQAKAKIAIFEAARARLATLTDAERADAIARRILARPEVSDRKRLRDTLVQS